MLGSRHGGPTLFSLRNRQPQPSSAGLGRERTWAYYWLLWVWFVRVFLNSIEQFGCFFLGLSSLDLRLTKFSPRRICTLNLSPFLNRESRSHRLAL